MKEGYRRRPGSLKAYVAAVFVLGLLAFTDALQSLTLAGLPSTWVILAMLAVGSQFTKLSSIKVPGISAHLSVSEILLFMIVLMYGGAPAVVTVAVDGLIFSLRQELKRKRDCDLHYAAFDFAEPSLSMWVASEAFVLLSGVGPLWMSDATLADIGLPALAMSVIYFVMNSGLSALAEALASQTAAWPLWRTHFKDLGANYLNSASIAAVLSHHIVSASPSDIFKVLAVIAPLVLTSFYVVAVAMRSLEEKNRHVAEMERLNLTLAEALAMTAEAKDRSTSRGHIRRVRDLSMQLARAAGITDPQGLQAIEFAGLLHDYGKTAIPDHLLNKPGRLTAGEYEVMKTHASAGADMVARIGFKFPVVPIIRHHHENWDGSGYPDNLQGEAIPLAARVLAVVDCYDALRDHRPYRRALSHDQAMAILRDRSGKMYDPAVVSTFESLAGRIRDDSWADATVALPVVVPDPSDAIPDPDRDNVLPLPIELRLSATRTLVQLHQQLALLDPQAGVETTCGIVAQHLLRLAPAGLVVFYRRDDAADELAAAYASGFGEALVRPVRMPLGHKVSGWVAVNGRPVINADSTLDLDDLLDNVEPRFRSLLSIPLPLLDRTIGVVTLYAFQEQAFREEQREALDLVRHAVGQAFWRALQNDRVRAASGSPVGVPGPATRRALDAMLAMDDPPAPGRSRSVGVLCVQGDGDAGVMADATMAVTKAVRVADLIFAPTDDSLVVLMRDSDPDAGRIVTQRIAEALPAGLPPQSSHALPLRIGYACSPHDGGTIRQLLDTAWQRLRLCGPATAPLRQSAPAVGASIAQGGHR